MQVSQLFHTKEEPRQAIEAGYRFKRGSCNSTNKREERHRAFGGEGAGGKAGVDGGEKETKREVDEIYQRGGNKDQRLTTAYNREYPTSRDGFKVLSFRGLESRG